MTRAWLLLLFTNGAVANSRNCGHSPTLGIHLAVIDTSFSIQNIEKRKAICYNEIDIVQSGICSDRSIPALLTGLGPKK